MASPAVTHTFSNGTTADATQVNTNFTDIINSLTDGTKTLSIDALTCAGAATLNGNVTLGNATADDITFTGSLASSIPIKTTNSFNIGSATLGLGTVYFGNGSNSNTVGLLGGVTTSSYTITLPTAAGSSNEILQTSGSGVMKFVPIDRNTFDMQNIAVACSVGSSALTIALKGHDGNDLSATNRGYVAFRDATAATGTPNVRELSGALSLVIDSGATLGHADATDHYIYVYLIDNAGTVTLGASSVQFDEGTVQSSTTCSSGADDPGVLYEESGQSSKPIRLIARLKSNQTTAGTWAAVPTEISPVPFPQDIVSFAAYRSSNQTISSSSPAIIICNNVTGDTTFGDTHGAYDTSTGIYTIPVSGWYIFQGAAVYSGATSENFTLYITDGTRTLAINDKDPTGGGTKQCSGRPCKLNKGDTVSLYTDSLTDSSYTIVANKVTYFSGYMVR